MTEQAVEEQAASASERVLALYSAYRSGQIARESAESAMVAAVFMSKVVASRLADIVISTLSSMPPLGIVPGKDHIERLEQSVRTVLDEEDSPDLADSLDHDNEDESDDPVQPAGSASQRLARLAQAETRTSHQKALRAAVAGQGFPSYREKVAANACSVCRPFSDRLHSAIEPWEPHHPNCRCSLVPVGEPITASETKTEPHRRVTIRRIAQEPK